ncbi:DMT family transporter [Permianibacter sp. IMCC34836]|uniref:EamA family transporter n=1 Tax=Permianibacter fluminis TaxID=2738515 RepID=UPI0015546673|nr:DMT family transporter [Permianibacter fluminis]NQD36030.1 DMT family transporter [Permianibacter fluminis]
MNAGGKSGLLAAAGAILLWSSLAALVSQLSALPPLLLTGSALLIGALVSLPHWRQWRVPWPTFLLGSSALFGYHLLLFLALRWAPPVSANLINYLWPLLIVLLSPLFDRRLRLGRYSLLAALLGFAGAAVAILSRPSATGTDGAPLGYLLALLAAIIWASYSQLLRRLPPFSSWAVGGFALAAGLASLLSHAVLEPAAVISSHDAVRLLTLLLVLGFGPMGLAFVLWDRAMKQADPRQVGVLSYATPVLSTTLLLLVTGEPLTLAIAMATALVVAAALLSLKAG